MSFDPSLSTEVGLIDGWIDGWIDAVISLTAVLCPACAQLVASSTPESPPPDASAKLHSPNDSLIIWTRGGSSTKYQTPYLSRALLIPRKSGSNLIFTEDLHRKKPQNRISYHNQHFYPCEPNCFGTWLFLKRPHYIQRCIFDCGATPLSRVFP